MKRLVSVLLSVMMIAGVFTSLPLSASAASGKVWLKKNSANLTIKKKKGKTVYGTVKITVNKIKGVKIKKKSFKSDAKAIAKVSKKGLVTAKKQGKTKIRVSVKYRYNRKNKKETLEFNVSVTDKRTKTPKPAVKPTDAPATAPETVTVPETTEAVEVTSAPVDTSAAETAEPSTAAGTETAETTALFTEGNEETVAATNGDGDVIMPTEEIQGDTSHCEQDAPSYNPNPYPAGVETDPYGYTFPPETTEETTTAPEETTSAPEETAPATEATTPEETMPAPETFNEKLSAFSNKLYTMAAAQDDGNYIFSPVSVYFALSLLYSVGDNNVKQDIEDFVGMTDEEIKKSGELFNSLIKEYTKDGELIGEVALSNSVWNDVTVSDRLNEDKLKELADDYNSLSFEAPFSTDNESANEMITDFVKEQTRGLIDKDFKIPASTVFALINTIYFKDVWNLGRDDLFTEEKTFRTDNDSKQCEFLEGYYFDGKIQSADTFDYFFTKMAHGYKIKFILPKDGYTLDEVMTAENLYKVNQKKDYEAQEVLKLEDLTEAEINYYLPQLNDWDNPEDIRFNCNNYTRCIFPSFKIKSHSPLKDLIKDSGYLPSAFGTFFTELLKSELPGDNLLTVSDIIQDAVIEVDKSGVKAAAVTIIEVEEGCAAPEEIEIDRYYELVMDKNFAFILTDSNDVILFEGKVYDPTV